MPLVTLTCSTKCYPPDDNATTNLQTRQRLVLCVAQELPGLVERHKGLLRLDPSTTATAVQVDIQKFHARAVNSVDLWFRVDLTEATLPKGKRLEARDAWIAMLDKLLAAHHGGGLSWALDLLYSAGHGCYVNSNGGMEFTW